MEKLKPEDIVEVYNEMYCVVNASSNNTTYSFEGMKPEEGVPYIIEMPFSEVKSINSRSALFREGYLRFFYKNPEQEARVYDSLFIRDYKDILTNNQIKDIILNRKAEELEKLLAVKSSSYWERIKGVYYALKKSKAYDISVRVCDLLDARNKELACNKLTTALKVVGIEQEREDNVDDLKAQIEELKAQLEAKKTIKKKTTETVE